MTSERRRTVGNAASVVRYVFAVQASSLPSGERLKNGREKLKTFVALRDDEHHENHQMGKTHLCS
jgi:hypothetical protein